MKSCRAFIRMNMCLLYFCGFCRTMESALHKMEENALSLQELQTKVEFGHSNSLSEREMAARNRDESLKSNISFDAVTNLECYKQFSVLPLCSNWLYGIQIWELRCWLAFIGYVFDWNCDTASNKFNLIPLVRYHTWKVSRLPFKTIVSIKKNNTCSLLRRWGKITMLMTFLYVNCGILEVLTCISQLMNQFCVKNKLKNCNPTGRKLLQLSMYVRFLDIPF